MNYNRVSELNEKESNNLYRFLLSIIFGMFDPEGDCALRNKRNTDQYRKFGDVYLQSINIIVKNGEQTIENIKNEPIFGIIVDTVNAFIDKGYEKVDPEYIVIENVLLADEIETFSSEFETKMVNEFRNMQTQ